LNATATSMFAAVKKSAEQIRNDENQCVGTVSPGDVIRQGDLYLVALGDLKGIETTPIADRQLAPGETQGSRHVIAGPADMLKASSPNAVASRINKLVRDARVEPALVGPLVLAGAGCELTHPEHGNFQLPAGELFAVVYQRAFAEEVRRQQD